MSCIKREHSIKYCKSHFALVFFQYSIHPDGTTIRISMPRIYNYYSHILYWNVSHRLNFSIYK